MLFHEIKTPEETEEICRANKRVFFYGNGTVFTEIWEYFTCLRHDYLNQFAGILNSDEVGEAYGLKVLKYEPGYLKKGDAVILSMCSQNNYAVAKKLLQDGFDNLFTLSYHMVHQRDYDRVLESVRPYMEDFENGVRLGINHPIRDEAKNHVWTMWWQGEENAPEMVRACWANRKFFLGDDVLWHVITEKNWMRYIELPEMIIKKARKGQISLATLSDVVRSCLLYKHGGIWFDAEVLLLRPFDKMIFEEIFYSRRDVCGHFGAGVSWGLSFLEGRPGWLLYEFLQEMWIRYLVEQDAGNIYHRTDYFIAIAANRYPEVRNAMEKVPLNNVIVDELMLHLEEPYSKEALRKYTCGCFFTNMDNKYSGNGGEGSIYEQIREDPIKIFLDMDKK